jgi:hypothetical protein
MKPFVMILVCLAALGQSAAAPADSPPPPRPPEPKTVCIEVYQPVCGSKNGKHVTYSNSCFAKADGATEVSDGACGPGDQPPVKH